MAKKSDIDTSYNKGMSWILNVNNFIVKQLFKGENNLTLKHKIITKKPG